MLAFLSPQRALSKRQYPPRPRRPWATTLDRRKKSKCYKVQPNAIPDRSGEAPQTISPTVRRQNDRCCRPARSPGTERRNEKQDSPVQDSPVDEANRNALFQDFVKWAVGQDPIRPPMTGANAAPHLRARRYLCRSCLPPAGDRIRIAEHRRNGLPARSWQRTDQGRT
jgi:hypothetical protein